MNRSYSLPTKHINDRLMPHFVFLLLSRAARSLSSPQKCSDNRIGCDSNITGKYLLGMVHTTFCMSFVFSWGKTVLSHTLSLKVPHLLSTHSGGSGRLSKTPGLITNSRQIGSSSLYQTFHLLQRLKFSANLQSHPGPTGRQAGRDTRQRMSAAKKPITEETSANQEIQMAGKKPTTTKTARPRLGKFCPKGSGTRSLYRLVLCGIFRGLTMSPHNTKILMRPC